MPELFVQGDSDDDELQLELSKQVHESEEGREFEKAQDHGIESALPESSIDGDIDDEVSLYPLIPNDPNENENQKPNIEDIRAVNINMTLPLSFQQKMVENILVSEDPLVIMGKGLGMSKIVANLLHILATPTVIKGTLKRSLVLVLNARSQDNQRIQEELQELAWISEENNTDEIAHPDNDVSPDPFLRDFHVVTADALTIEKRSKLYLSGGIISVTSRILIVDLLSGIVHPNRITGMVVLNVDSLRHYSNESFIIEIYRSRNKWGFIKAFSEAPESFVMEFSPLMRKMKDLRLKNVLLWPRFRVEVSGCLNQAASTSTNKVTEVKVSLTNSMSQIQFGLIECLKKCIDELKRKNPELALEWWNIENALDTNFLHSINSVMMPNWHRISYESKQLVKDIRFLKSLMSMLVRSDAVDFYEEVQLSIEANKPQVSRKYSESPWLMAEESQMVIAYARKRVIDNHKYVLEELPKWEQLAHLLEDIAFQRSKSHAFGPTLIMCSDSTTCFQIARVLNNTHQEGGLQNIMLRKLQWYKERKELRKVLIKEVKHNAPEVRSELNVSAAFAKEQIQTKRRRTRGSATVAAVEKLRTAGSGGDIETIIENFTPHDEIQDDNDQYMLDEGEFERYTVSDDDDSEGDLLITKDSAQRVTKEAWEEKRKDYAFIHGGDEIIIEKFRNVDSDSLLQELMPSYIIMYEPDLNFIRKVEMYMATYHDFPPKVYFMYYGDSIEEQHHLTSIKREKDAFTKLIRENAMLAHHFEADEDLSHLKNLANRKMKLHRMRKTSTRIAGGQESLQQFTQDIVIVDTREFNASLPGLLFRYGVRVLPCMLTVGDYILNPDICVERKSISDLIGSLQNNRLVSQCKKMTRYYKYPTLLIEFEEGQSFSLEPFSERRNYKNKELSTTHPISDKLSQDEIQLKLAKLVMRFPTLKIIWSSSPLQTVNIIIELKLGREQPDPSASTLVGVKSITDSRQTSTVKIVDTDKLRQLLNIPGISKIDYFNIRKKVKSYKKLVGMNLESLEELLGDRDLALKVYQFIKVEEERQEDDNDDGGDVL